METIKSTANRVGLSEETLRKYEKYGVLTPLVNERSGYRYYHFTDISRLLSCKKLRQCGFSLKETAALLNEPELMVVESEFAKKERQIENEYKRQARILQSMKLMRQEIENLTENIGHYKIEHRPVVLYLPQSLQRPLTSPETNAVKVFTDHMPITRVTAYIKYDKTSNTATNDGYGFSINETDYPLIEQINFPKLIHLPAGDCLTTILDCRMDFRFSQEDIPRAVQYVKNHGFQISDDIFLDTIVCTGEGDDIHAYRKMWMMIKK